MSGGHGWGPVWRGGVRPLNWGAAKDDQGPVKWSPCQQADRQAHTTENIIFVTPLAGGINVESPFYGQLMHKNCTVVKRKWLPKLKVLHIAMKAFGLHSESELESESGLGNLNEI